jgi:uncharacterized protein DUF4397
MRSLIARLAVLGAFALSIAGCSGGNGTSLPAAGPPNSNGGTPGIVQSGASGTALLRFIQGSPDATGVDVCVDNQAFGVTNPLVAYGKTSGLFGISSGIGHIISVYATLGGASIGLECSTAPGPYLANSALAVTTLTPSAATRYTVVLGGTAAAKTFGLYAFQEPNFVVAPAGSAVVSHNAAPSFSAAAASGVGFGTCATTVTPCTPPAAVVGAQNLAAPKPSTTTAALPTTPNPVVQSPLAAIPAGFYDGKGVAAGTAVPITSVAAPTPVAAQPYVVDLYAIDGPAGGLNLVSYVESTSGFPF